MNRIQLSAISTWLVFSVLACSSDPADSVAGSGSGGAADGSGAGNNAGSGSAPANVGGTAANAGGTAANAGGAGPANAGGESGSGAGPAAGGAGNTGGAAGDGGAGGAAGGGLGTGGTTSLIPTAQPKLVTSGEGAYWQEGDFLAVADATATVTVDDTKTYQTWLGFGGTFNEAGWDAIMSSLSPEDQALAIKLLFDINEGAGFDWGRIPIGASDYAMSRYTLAETPDDYEMANFSIARDQEMLIPYIKAALAVKPDVRLWASPWSPPAWMKDSGKINGTDEFTDSPATFTSSMLTDAQTLDAFALYLARFVEDYATEGLTIEHVEPQNEPGYATRYPSCLWDPGLMGSFISDHLGPTFDERGLSTEIWFGTLSNEEKYAGHIAGLTGATADRVVGVGLQWNTIGHVGQLAGDGYIMLQTEHKCGNYPWLSARATSAADANYNNFLPGMAPNNHAYGEESWGLIKEWLEAGVQIYSAWNMILDTLGQNLDEQRPWPQNALLVVDRDAGTLTPTPAYYVFRHLSQFVDAGATRIDVSGDALAFKNPDGSIVTVLSNSGSSDADTILGVGGTTLQFTVPARGWATVNYEP